MLFGAVDLSSGYHQVSIHPDSRDLFTIILPNGRYKHNTLPHGCSISSDYFNLCTDEEIRGETEFYKNIDHIFVTSPTLRRMEERMKKLLKVCRKRNVKLSQDKLQLGREVVYGWTNIEGARQKGDKKTRVYISPSLEKFTLKSPSTEVQRR